jgi:hypothetical protein
MVRQPVVSSSIIAVGYDSLSAVLEIEFQAGGTYNYFGVPAFQFRNLMAAQSHGKYFASNIRDRYAFRKIR